jgi:hypothetical protein
VCQAESKEFTKQKAGGYSPALLFLPLFPFLFAYLITASLSTFLLRFPLPCRYSKSTR